MLYAMDSIWTVLHNADIVNGTSRAHDSRAPRTAVEHQSAWDEAGNTGFQVVSQRFTTCPPIVFNKLLLSNTHSNDINQFFSTDSTDHVSAHSINT